MPIAEAIALAPASSLKPPLGFELVVEPPKMSYGSMLSVAARMLDLLPGPLDIALHAADITGSQDPLQCGHFRIFEFVERHFLGEIADPAGLGDRPVGRLRFADERLHERRLARAITPDQTDLVASLNSE